MVRCKHGAPIWYFKPVDAGKDTFNCTGTSYVYVRLALSAELKEKHCFKWLSMESQHTFSFSKCCCSMLSYTYEVTYSS